MRLAAVPAHAAKSKYTQVRVGNAADATLIIPSSNAARDRMGRNVAFLCRIAPAGRPTSSQRSVAR